MVDTGDFLTMELDALADGCKGETLKFLQQLASDTRYCFELLCRACRDHLEAALEHVFKIYVPMLAGRARKHPAFSHSCQDADGFARTALANFYHAVNGDRFVEKFSTLPQALAYLYTCLHTEILQDIRKHGRDTALEYAPAAPADEPSVDPHEIWTHIRRLLPDEWDQRLAYLRFVLDMKPAEIVQRYPQAWKTQREVTIALYRIRRLLRKDSYLRGLAGLSDQTPP